MGCELTPVVEEPAAMGSAGADYNSAEYSSAAESEIVCALAKCSTIDNDTRTGGSGAVDGDGEPRPSYAPPTANNKKVSNFDTISPLLKRMVPVETLTPSQLHDMMTKEDVLVIDSRSKLLFNAEHVEGALSIPCHPTHGGKSVGSITKMESLLSNAEQQKFRRRDIALAVVIYDQSSAQATQFSRAGTIARLLQEEGAVQALYTLEGGFSKFSTLYPDQCKQPDGRSREKLKKNLRKKLGKYYDMYMELSGDDAASGAKTGPSEILPFLLVGSHEDARSVDTLRKHGVEYVLNMAEECPVWFPHQFTYHHCRAQDHADERLDMYFDEAFAFIDRARLSSSRILVHCHMGRSRAPTLVMAYLMREGYPLSEAYRLVSERRPQICPNRGFSMILANHECRLLGSGGAVPSMPADALYNNGCLESPAPIDGLALGEAGSPGAR